MNTNKLAVRQPLNFEKEAFLITEECCRTACLWRCGNNFFKGKLKNCNVDICIFTQGLNLSFAMVLDNTTSPIKTMYQARDKEIVEVPWFSTLWQSFNWKTCCHLMNTCIVYVCKLYLKNRWVTLHPWVCHLKCSLCLLALPKESLGYTAPMGVLPKCSLCLLSLPKESVGYTAPMGVPPKVQPMFVSST